jgi:hypothetical protein
MVRRSEQNTNKGQALEGIQKDTDVLKATLLSFSITITVLEDFLSPIIVQEHSLFEWIISSAKISREMVARLAMTFTIWKQICFLYGIALDSRLTSKLEMDRLQKEENKTYNNEFSSIFRPLRYLNGSSCSSSR